MRGAQGGGTAVEVLREDQERINRFNRLHTKVTELEALVKAKKVNRRRRGSHRVSPAIWSIAVLRGGTR